MPMALIVPGKVVYLCTPRTGSTSVQVALQDIYPEAIVTEEHHTRYGDEGVQNAIAGGEIVVSNTRCIFDVITSWYYLNREWWRYGMLDFINQYRHTYFQDRIHFHLEDCTQLINYYHFQRDFDILLECLDVTHYKLPYLNITAAKRKHIFTAEEIAAIRRRFPFDMERAP